MIPEHRLRTAAATLGAYLAVLVAALYLLTLTENVGGGTVGEGGFPFEDLVFETTSALGTVGLSRGITGDLSRLGRLVFVGIMFLGRLGPLSFGVALVAHRPEPNADPGALQTDPEAALPEEDLAV